MLHLHHFLLHLLLLHLLHHVLYRHLLHLRQVLEVGAGYTSLWLLQALRDNADELARCEASQAADGY